MDLPAKWKLAWYWILDNCDHAGIVEANPRLMSFVIGEPIDGDEFIRVMSGRVTKPKQGKWFIPRFIAFQYGDKLNPENSAHKGVIRKLAEAGIPCPVKVLDSSNEAPSKPLQSPCQGAQDKDKDMDKDKEVEKEPEKTPDQIRVEKLYRRKATTKWSASEIRAWRTAREVIAQTSPEGWALIEWWYGLDASKAPYRKTDMAALLNNWHAEIAKAERNKHESKEQTPRFNLGITNS